MGTDYISQEANGDDFVRRADIVEKFMDRLPSISVGYLCKIADEIPAADVRPVPSGGIGEMSDGYHTFNGLYYQRLVLFAALVKQNKDSAWKSHRHEDGELCFGGGWFIVGIDTPEGSYTYHYEDKDWDLFDCEELPVGKHWDGHTEDDVTRLLSLPEVRPVVFCRECKWYRESELLAPNRFCFRLKENDGKPVGYNFAPNGFCSYGKRRGANMGGTP